MYEMHSFDTKETIMTKEKIDEYLAQLEVDDIHGRISLLAKMVLTKDLDKVRYLKSKIEQVIVNSDDDEIKCYFYYLFATYQVLVEDYNQAIDLVLRIRTIDRNEKYSEYSIVVIRDILFRNGLYKEAYPYCNKLIDLYEEKQNIFSLCMEYINLLVICQKIGNDEQIKFVLEKLEYYRTQLCGNEETLIGNLYDLEHKMTKIYFADKAKKVDLVKRVIKQYQEKIVNIPILEIPLATHCIINSPFLKILFKYGFDEIAIRLFEKSMDITYLQNRERIDLLFELMKYYTNNSSDKLLETLMRLNDLLYDDYLKRHGNVAGSVIAKIELSMLNNKMDEINNKYSIDPLTNCLSRGVMLERITRMFSNAKGGSVVFIDLNKMKLINDEYGHQVGDEYLHRFVTDTLKLLPKKWEMYRYGGDEFVIAAPTTQKRDIEGFLKTMEKEFQKPKKIKMIKTNISYSRGYAHYPSDATTIESLIRAADKHMYRNKYQQRDTKDKQENC